ncbi:MAG: class I tRNA ligase family protein, partial [Patescibacteria group bacterium]
MNLPEKEKEILKYWRENKIFERALVKTKKGKPFVFYEGPPYANGKPGIHHVLARAYKDIILRFKTMQGYYVARKAGWDTHGLPTEMEVEKKLGVRTKKEIEEKIGIENFVEEARNNVFFYKEEWERLTERMAYWLDLKHPYVTMTNDYIEGLWWIFSQIAKNGYLYKDYKVLPWCPRCETSLSSHELAQGYQKVKDESIYVKFPIKQPASQNSKIKAYFLVWTTTPWTLPGNVALALSPKAKYTTIEADGEWLILVKDRLSVIGRDYKVISEESGDRLVGVEYEPLYKGNSQQSTANRNLYRVVGGDFVSTKDGTGIVHIAPAFGNEDQKIGKVHGLPTLVTVGEDGRMQTAGSAWHEKTFLEANPLIIKNLEARKLLYKVESYEHDYPFCWRCKSALMYYAKDSWFLKTTAVKKRMIEENKKINWNPKFVGEARFGAWLKENVDWAISRERYWGMPL